MRHAARRVRQRLCCLCAAAAVIGGGAPTHGQSGARSDTARAAYARAIEKVEHLQQLDALVRNQRDAGLDLAAGGRYLESAIQRSRRDVQAAGDTVRQASECAGAVSRDVEESTQVADEYQRAARESLVRTAEFSRATDGAAAARLAASEAALARRTERKDALLRRGIQGAKRACSQRVLDSKRAVESADRAFESVVRDTRELASNMELVQRLTLQLVERATEVRKRGWLSIEVPAPVFPQATAMRALLDRVELLDGMGNVEIADPHPDVAARLADYQDTVLRAVVEEDALQLLAALARNAAETCEAAECSRLLADVDVQRDVLRDARKTVEYELARVRQAIQHAPGLGVFVAPTSEWTETQVAVESAFENARAEVTAVAGLAERIAAALAAPVAQALDKAILQRSEAYYRAFGVTEPIPSAPPLREPGVAAGAAPPTGASARPSRPLRQHAFEVLALRSREAEEYGAYTYVIFPGRDERPEYQALLRAIVSLTPAADPDAPVEVKNATNLFEIPGKSAEPIGQDRAPDYASRLENYDRARALSLVQTAIAGVLTAPKVLRQFQRSPGPFLLTVPVPLDRAKGTTQLLLADLSGYPAAGFQDLVKSYQNDLIAAFPTDQTLWRPPWNQRLALGLMNIGVAITGQNFVALRR